MNKLEAAKKKAQWLAGCLAFGWKKSDLDDLGEIWDQFRDEYGNYREQQSTDPETLANTADAPIDGSLDQPVIEDLQDQVRAHIKDHALFNWDEALSGEEMIYLESLLLTFNPLCPPGSIGYEEQVRHIARHRGANSSQHPGGYLKVLEENFEATKRMPKSEYKNKLLETYEDLIAIYKAGFGQGEYSRAAIEASLTTSQHGGDTGKLVLWNGIEGEMEDVESLEHARQWLRENYADPEEGIHPDIELCEVYRLVATVAVVDGKQSGTSRIEVQPTQSTPTPPGIVEQLKRECPFTNYSEEEIIAWDKCCDTLATLLSVGEKGEEKKEDRS